MREMVPSSAVDGRAMIGLPPLRARGSPDEVHLAADPRVEELAQRVRADLAGEVDLERRVDGDHAVVLGDDEGVVRVLGRVELDDRVVVDEVVERFRAHARSEVTILPAVERLAAVRDDAGVDQSAARRPRTSRCGCRGRACRRGGEYRVRDLADPQLERGAVSDEIRDVRPICGETRSRLRLRRLEDGLIAGDQRRRCRATWMKQSPSVRGIRGLTSAMTTWRASDRGSHDVDRDAEASSIRASSGAADLDERDVDRTVRPVRKSAGISDRKTGV